MPYTANRSFKSLGISRPTFGCLIVFVCFLAIRPANADEFFKTSIAPLLTRHCLRCHNAEKPSGDLDLTTAAAVQASGYIIPGAPEESHLLTTVLPGENGAQPAMPQSGPALTSEESSLLRRWIAEGAVWPEDAELAPPDFNPYDWWSLQPVSVTDADVAGSPEELAARIDQLIHNRLAQAGLQPASRAADSILLRRLSYDLTGLPPGDDQRAASDGAHAADWKVLVDEFLASPHYGEHWARHWLDVVKYADTCGYDKDKLRPDAWPYRDYVIAAFNEDKPYPEFVREQIAADALYPDDPTRIPALGFLAAGPWDFIGHVEVPESKQDGMVARNLDRDDMVSNTLNTFCSVTVQCARCHDHKFDPITQADYYGLQSVFAAVDRAPRPYESDPTIAEERQRLNVALTSEREALQRIELQISDVTGPEVETLQAEIDGQISNRELDRPAAYGYHSGLHASADHTVTVTLTLPKATVANQVVLYACHDDYAGIGAGFGFPHQFQVEVSANGQDWQPTRIASGATDLARHLLPVHCRFPESPVRAIRITATKLKERRRDFHVAFSEVELQLFDSAGEHSGNLLQNAVIEAADSIEAPERWSRQNLTDGKRPAFWNRSREFAIAKAVERLAKLRVSAIPRRLREQRIKRQAVIQKLQEQLANLPAPSLVYAAATEFTPQGNFHPTNGVPRPVHVLRRGDIGQKAEVAVPGVLRLSEDESASWSNNLPENDRRRRFAEWLTRPEHPLFWRSMANRIWQYHFNRGLVATPNDFGRMGALPSHPKLLDLLAARLRWTGGSVKDLHRCILLTHAWQQDSANHPEGMRQDNQNELLWRMNRRRLQSEEIRDTMLMAAGLMNSQMGGPGFYLFDLQKTTHSPHYEYHLFNVASPTSHRRSIYRFIVRSQPDPWMTVLDCADSSQSTPRRVETLTPLQALTLWNSPFATFVSAEIAERISQTNDNPQRQITAAFQRILQRDPTEKEREQLSRYTTNHGLANACRLLFNLSEFLYVD